MAGKKLDFHVDTDLRVDQMTEEVMTAANRGLKALAIEIDRMAKDNAPVDTGRLRASINYEVDDLQAIVGTNVEYAAVQEYRKQYLRRSLESNKRNIDRLVISQIRRAMK